MELHPLDYVRKGDLLRVIRCSLEARSGYDADVIPELLYQRKVLFLTLVDLAEQDNARKPSA